AQPGRAAREAPRRGQWRPLLGGRVAAAARGARPRARVGGDPAPFAVLHAAALHRPRRLHGHAARWQPPVRLPGRELAVAARADARVADPAHARLRHPWQRRAGDAQRVAPADEPRQHEFAQPLPAYAARAADRARGARALDHRRARRTAARGARRRRRPLRERAAAGCRVGAGRGLGPLGPDPAARDPGAAADPARARGGGAVSAPARETELRFAGPLDLIGTLAPLRPGPGVDPTVALAGDGLVRASATPEGPATLLVEPT